VLLDRNIWRGGFGIAYRRSFNNFYEFLHHQKTITDAEPTLTNEKPVEKNGNGKVKE
jgi:hypothetical protein